jgi:rhomboid protease GluP
MCAKPADTEPAGFDDDDVLDIDDSMVHRGPAVDFEKGMSIRPSTSVLLIAACVIAFGFQFAKGGLFRLETMIDQGALEAGRVQEGEWWRTISAAFLHGGPDHLIGNMLMLFVLGMACEHAFGAGPFLMLYVASALGGSALSLALGNKPSVGASGAIFGLAGGLIGFFLRNRSRIHLRDHRIAFVLAIWAGYQLLLGFGLLNETVDNRAHLGGLLAGLLIGFVLPPAPLADDRKAFERSPFSLGAFALALVVLAATAVEFVPRLIEPR